MELITAIFNIVIALVLKLLQLILMPIDWLIKTAIPSLAQGLTDIASFLVLMAQGLGWAISASGLPPALLVLIALYTIFKLSVPIQLWFIKLAVSWYRALKP